MDFLLFYSKFSKHSASLLEDVPLLNEKTICVDSQECRELLKRLPYKVERVPTLLIVDGVDKIIKVIEGSADIKNWFTLATLSMSSGVAAAEPNYQPQTRPVYTQEESVVEEDELMPQGVSSLSDLSPPSEEYVLKTDKVSGVKGLAEELQRQRETFIEKTTDATKGPPRLS